jgi:hypothetical protein
MVKKEEKIEEEKVEAVVNEIVVSEAKIFTPQARPEVVSPSSGVWDNPAQEALAKVLNDYAYTNPKKWAVKKDVLVQQLKDLGNK